MLSLAAACAFFWLTAHCQTIKPSGMSLTALIRGGCSCSTVFHGRPRMLCTPCLLDFQVGRTGESKFLSTQWLPVCWALRLIFPDGRCFAVVEHATQNSGFPFLQRQFLLDPARCMVNQGCMASLGHPTWRRCSVRGLEQHSAPTSALQWLAAVAYLCILVQWLML